MMMAKAQVEGEEEEVRSSWVSLSREERQHQTEETDSRERDSEFLYLDN